MTPSEKVNIGQEVPILLKSALIAQYSFLGYELSHIYRIFFVYRAFVYIVIFLSLALIALIAVVVAAACEVLASALFYGALFCVMLYLATKYKINM